MLESIYYRGIGTNTDVLVALGYSYKDVKTISISSSRFKAYMATLGIIQSLADTIEGEIHFAFTASESNLIIRQIHTSLKKILL